MVVVVYGGDSVVSIYYGSVTFVDVVCIIKIHIHKCIIFNDSYWFYIFQVVHRIVSATSISREQRQPKEGNILETFQG